MALSSPFKKRRPPCRSCRVYVHITHITHFYHIYPTIPVQVSYYVRGQLNAVSYLERNISLRNSNARSQCKRFGQSVNPRSPQPVQLGGHTRKWAVLSIFFNSAMSSSLKSTTLRFPDCMHSEMVINRPDNRLTDDTPGRDRLRHDFLKHRSADVTSGYHSMVPLTSHVGCVDLE